MKKDKTIIDLVNNIKLYSNIEDLDPIDYWDADLCAIGLVKEKKLVYISTFGFLNEIIPKYYYEFELLTDIIDDFTVVRTADGVTFNELIADMSSFFNESDELRK